MRRSLKKVFIIAEAGVNHNGDIRLAKKLIDAAKRSGADAIKFQSFKAEKLASQRAPKAGYQKKTTNKNESQFAMLKKLELKKEDHSTLFEYCREKRIMFMSTPFDEESTDLLDCLGVKLFKIPSGEVTNFPLLAHVAKKRKPMILSTGMSSLQEVKEAVKVIYKTGNKKLVLFHCTTEYPAPFNEINLRAIETLRKTFSLEVGYSDHSLGIEIAIAAVALGASVIEKHLTLDRDMKGPDHKASLEPQEFKQMVQSIRNIEKALGSGIKKAMPCEEKYKSLVRKSIVALCDIPKGELITEQLIAVKRPDRGIQPKYFNRIIGRRTRSLIKSDEPVVWKKIR